VSEGLTVYVSHLTVSLYCSAISGKQGRRESMRDGELVKAAQMATSGE
jgi:hypothetical protein